MNDPTPVLVSVCIPTYNSAAFVAETIESVLAQDHPSFELVIADHGSTDETAEVVRGYEHDPRVRLVIGEPGGGAQANWNRVTDLARGEYIKLVCADDPLYAGCLSQQAAVLDENPDVVLVASKRDIVDAQGRMVMRGRGLGGLQGRSLAPWRCDVWCRWARTSSGSRARCSCVRRPSGPPGRGRTRCPTSSTRTCTSGCWSAATSMRSRLAGDLPAQHDVVEPRADEAAVPPEPGVPPEAPQGPPRCRQEVRPAAGRPSVEGNAWARRLALPGAAPTAAGPESPRSDDGGGVASGTVAACRARRRSRDR